MEDFTNRRAETGNWSF